MLEVSHLMPGQHLLTPGTAPTRSINPYLETIITLVSTFNIQVLHIHTPDPGISPEVDEGVDAGVAHGYQQEHGVDVAEYVTGNKQIQIR